MVKSILAVVTLAALALFAAEFPARAEQLEKRVALVIGESDYAAAPLATAAADASLIAQTLQAAGFDVTGARNLDEDSLRHAFRDFLEKLRESGPDTVALVYFNGYGLQFEGDDFLTPVDLGRDEDAPSRSVRVSDFLRQLNGLQPKLGVVVLDAARSGPFVISGQPPASGLALVDPGQKILLAYNAAPGTVAPEEKGAYGVYAKTLAAAMREGGAAINEVFERARLRVSDLTRGAQIPWNTKVDASFVFFQKSPEAPTAAAAAEQSAAILDKPIRSLGPKEAYLAALARDTLPAYEEFEKTYPDDPMAKRVRAIMAARREALIWSETRHKDTPEAYWTYLREYAHGPHVRDARRRLQALDAALEPPRSFAEVEYDVPPPPRDEWVYVDRPVVIFDESDLPPPPPVPDYLAPPPPPAFEDLPPPVIIAEPHALPVPNYVPLPQWVEPPKHVAPPPQTNVIYANLHHEVALDKDTGRVVIRNARGEVVSPEQPAPGAMPPRPGAAALSPSLPPSVAKKIEEARPAKPTLSEEGRSALPGAPQAPAKAAPERPEHAQPEKNAGAPQGPGAPAVATAPPPHEPQAAPGAGTQPKAQAGPERATKNQELRPTKGREAHPAAPPAAPEQARAPQTNKATPESRRPHQQAAPPQRAAQAPHAPQAAPERLRPAPAAHARMPEGRSARGAGVAGPPEHALSAHPTATKLRARNGEAAAAGRSQPRQNRPPEQAAARREQGHGQAYAAPRGARPFSGRREDRTMAARPGAGQPSPARGAPADRRGVARQGAGRGASPAERPAYGFAPPAAQRESHRAFAPAMQRPAAGGAPRPSTATVPAHGGGVPRADHAPRPGGGAGLRGPAGPQRKP